MIAGIGAGAATWRIVRSAVVLITEMLRAAPTAAMTGRTAAWQSRVQGRLWADNEDSGACYSVDATLSPRPPTSPCRPRRMPKLRRKRTLSTFSDCPRQTPSFALEQLERSLSFLIPLAHRLPWKLPWSRRQTGALTRTLEGSDSATILDATFTVSPQRSNTNCLRSITPATTGLM